MEGFLEAVATFRHGFSADGNTAFDATITDLVRDILHSLQTRGAEAVDRGCGAGGGETGSKRGSTGDVGGFAVRYLVHFSKSNESIRVKYRHFRGKCPPPSAGRCLIFR